MDIVFCEACDGSISGREIEAGRAVRVEGRLYHLKCAPEAARARRVWIRSLAFLLLPPVLGLGYLVGRLVPPEPVRDDSDPRLERVAARVERLESEIGGLVATIRSTRDLVAEEGETTREGLAEYGASIEEIGTGVASLVARLEEIGRALEDVTEVPVVPDAIERDAIRFERALEVLRDGDEDEGMRFSAVKTLALSDDPRARPALRRALGDDAPSVRAYAATQLGQLRDRSAGGRLVTLLEDEERAVREAAHRALRIISDRDFPFDTLASADERAEQAEAWQQWWRESSED